MKKKIFPKISIITVVLNNERYIGRCIQSVIHQNYPKNKIEHIIIDGKSTDKTVSIIKKYEKKIFYWQSKNDLGLYDAMNIGIKKCTGDIIGILNSDDYYKKNALKIISKYFFNQKIDFLFGSVKKDRVYHNFFPNKLWYTFNIFPSHSVSFFIKRAVQNSIGLYDITFKYSSDRDLIYRLIKNKKFKGMATKKTEILGVFNMSGLSSRVSFFKKTLEEIRIRLSNNENFIQTFGVLLIFIIYHFIRKLFKK